VRVGPSLLQNDSTRRRRVKRLVEARGLSLASRENHPVVVRFLPSAGQVDLLDPHDSGARAFPKAHDPDLSNEVKNRKALNRLAHSSSFGSGAHR